MQSSKPDSLSGKKRVAAPLARKHMPTDFNISLDSFFGRKDLGRGYRPGEKRIPDHLGLKQSMQGFEPTYQNIIDYIVRITYRIWEDRDVEYISDTYSENSQVYDDYGLQLGSKKIIADTHHTTGAFSNIRLIADEVIWAGNDEVGFHSSHRTLIRGTNDGDSKYARATGKDIDVLVIANCVSLENEIFLEHVLYNNSSLIQQLGLNLEEQALIMARGAPAGWPRGSDTWDALRAAAKPEVPISSAAPVSGFDIDQFVRNAFSAACNRDRFGELANYYDPGFAFRGPTDRSLKTIDAYCAFLTTLFSSFTDLTFDVDEVYWMGNDEDGYLTSERWSAVGTHAVQGIYGEPTGCQAQIWGITQHRVVNGKIVEEWMLFNELDLMMQIAAARS